MSLYLSTHSHPLAAHPARVALGEAAGGHQAVAAPGAGQRGQDRGLEIHGSEGELRNPQHVLALHNRMIILLVNYFLDTDLDVTLLQLVSNQAKFVLCVHGGPLKSE